MQLTTTFSSLFKKLSLQLKIIFALSLYFFTLAGTFAQSASQTNLPSTTLFIQEHSVYVQLAQTPQEWSKGLMWRTSMPENEGMLFVFDKPSQQCFWMKNTFLPLSAAFIDDQGKIVNIADMQPLSTKEHCSEAPVRFVLEVHQGWFENNSFGAGDVVSGIKEFVPAQ